MEAGGNHESAIACYEFASDHEIRPRRFPGPRHPSLEALDPGQASGQRLGNRSSLRFSSTGISLKRSHHDPLVLALWPSPGLAAVTGDRGRREHEGEYGSTKARTQIPPAARFP